MLYFFFFFTNNRKLSIQTPTIFINNGFKKIFWLKMFILYIVVRKADEKWMVFFCDGIFVWKKNRIPNKKSQPLPLIIKAFWDITLFCYISPACNLELNTQVDFLCFTEVGLRSIQASTQNHRNIQNNFDCSKNHFEVFFLKFT